MIGESCVGKEVWAVWPDSRKVEQHVVREIVRSRPHWDSWISEWVTRGPDYVQFDNLVSCALENVFSTEVEAKAHMVEYCDKLIRSHRAIAEMWEGFREKFL